MLKDAGWKAALQEELSKPYFSEIADFVAAERSEHAVYPPEDLVFEAFFYLLNLTWPWDL